MAQQRYDKVIPTRSFRRDRSDSANAQILTKADRLCLRPIRWLETAERLVQGYQLKSAGRNGYVSSHSPCRVDGCI